MKHAVRYFALAVYVLCTGGAFAVAPQRTFVASTGNDANPCSLTAPCRSFQAAIDGVAGGGEVVVIDTAGYGAMEIHKSVSVIVPPGINAGLSPLVGIPLPGFPGQSTVVLIDIQSTDIVVLRGLNVSHQGAVTGGIDWLSANGGTVHVENVIVNGFPQEGLFMKAPGGHLFVRDSIFRDNGYGIYIRGATVLSLVYDFLDADRVRVVNSTWGITIEGQGIATIRDSVINVNNIGIHRTSPTAQGTTLTVDRCTISDNVTGIKVVAKPGYPNALLVAASIINRNSTTFDITGTNYLTSLGNNSSDVEGLFGFTRPLQ